MGRLVNAAVMAKIHSIEWTPAILPNDRLTMALNANWFGLLTYRFHRPEDRRAVAEFNVSSPELGGVVGNTLNKHGSPFGLTEEFVEVYRLHSLLPETLHLRRHDTGEELGEVAFPASRQAGSPQLTNRVGMTDLFYSFGNQHPGALVLNNYPSFMQELSMPGNPVFTPEGMQWVDDADLKTVPLRHHAELAGTGLANVKNAFEPWDTGRLDPEHHPLRAFEPELRRDPWRGEAASA